MTTTSVGLDETHPHQEPATGEDPVVVGVPLEGETAVEPIAVIDPAEAAQVSVQRWATFLEFLGSRGGEGGGFQSSDWTVGGRWHPLLPEVLGDLAAELSPEEHRHSAMAKAARVGGARGGFEADPAEAALISNARVKRTQGLIPEVNSNGEHGVRTAR